MRTLELVSTASAVLVIVAFFTSIVPVAIVAAGVIFTP